MIKLKTIYAEKYRMLTEMEKQLFRYVLSEPHTISRLSIDELSQQTHVSTSSISRFTQKLGFSGFREFKYFLQQEAQQISEGTSNYLDGDFLLEDLQRTKRLFQQAEVERVVHWLSQENLIYCYGTGTAQKIVAEDFARKMLFCGKLVVPIGANRELEFAAHNVHAGDVLMIFSLSGSVSKILPSVELFKQKGAKIVGFCQLGQNILTELADFTFFFQTQTLGYDRQELISFLPLNYLTELLQLAYRKKCSQNF